MLPDISACHFVVGSGDSSGLEMSLDEELGIANVKKAMEAMNAKLCRSTRVKSYAGLQE